MNIDCVSCHSYGAPFLPDSAPWWWVAIACVWLLLVALICMLLAGAERTQPDFDDPFPTDDDMKEHRGRHLRATQDRATRQRVRRGAGTYRCAGPDRAQEPRRPALRGASRRRPGRGA